MTWATPCDGNRECIDGSDEEGCETPIWILALILYGLGLLLFVTFFLYSFKSVNEAVRKISYNEELYDSFKNKQLYIGILTEKNDIKMIEQLFRNEVKMQGNEGEAICYFKVCTFFHYTFKDQSYFRELVFIKFCEKMFILFCISTKIYIYIYI